jgi:hypothetical protein
MRRIRRKFEDFAVGEAIAKKRKMTDAERLSFHQKKSGPPMKKFRTWMRAQFAEKKIKPSSGMGQAISYMPAHWKKLTPFLRKTGAPLDNNVVEMALKMAILHRKNSLFYKSDRGAGVGDIYMSLVHTCDLNGVDALDYLTQLQQTPGRSMRIRTGGCPGTFARTSPARGQTDRLISRHAPRGMPGARGRSATSAAVLGPGTPLRPPCRGQPPGGLVEGIYACRKDTRDERSAAYRYCRGRQSGVK